MSKKVLETEEEKANREAAETQKAVENLRLVTAEFNAALLSAVFKKTYELRQNSNVTDIELYRFDFDSCKKVPVDNKISTDNLDYYWIEYKEKTNRKKFAFFFKDIDSGSKNIHTVPGLCEEYKYEDTCPKDIPYAELDPDSGKFIKNISNQYLADIDSNCPFFCREGCRRRLVVSVE